MVYCSLQQYWVPWCTAVCSSAEYLHDCREGAAAVVCCSGCTVRLPGVIEFKPEGKLKLKSMSRGKFLNQIFCKPIFQVRFFGLSILLDNFDTFSCRERWTYEHPSNILGDVGTCFCLTASNIHDSLDLEQGMLNQVLVRPKISMNSSSVMTPSRTDQGLCVYFGVWPPDPLTSTSYI